MDGTGDQDEMWAGFASAVVRFKLAGGTVTLWPFAGDNAIAFPFEGPAHIVTAFNPAGRRSPDDENRRSDLALGEWLGSRHVVRTLASDPEGHFAEPGFAIVGMELDEALELGAAFGQRAIYRWTEDILRIVGVSENVDIGLGWHLSRDGG